MLTLCCPCFFPSGTHHQHRQSQLLLHLSYELANETKSETGRQLAGLYLKNTIAAKVRRIDLLRPRPMLPLH